MTSNFLDRILVELSETIPRAVNGGRLNRNLVLHVLFDLTKLEAPPSHLTEIAYTWCSEIYQNRDNIGAWKYPLLVCLKAGFRHLDPWRPPTDITLTHTEHHQGLVDEVFKNPKNEKIADLLHTRTLGRRLAGPTDPLDSIIVERLVGLHDQFSSRLRRLVIRFVEVVGYKGFEGVGVEVFVELLDRLGVEVEDMDEKRNWMSLLFDVIRSHKGASLLPDSYWKLLVELTISEQLPPEFENTPAAKIAMSLTDADEWDKLECWIGIVWMCSDSQDAFNVALEDLEGCALMLFQQRPGARQRLEQRMGEWRQRHYTRNPASVLPFFTLTNEAVERQDSL